MTVAPLTRASLLVRIRDGRDHDAWQQFVAVYAPVVYGFARKRGLQDADAADVMQDVLRSVARVAGKLNYDPGRGSFRGWLYTIARNKILNLLTASSRQERGSGDSGVRQKLEEQPAAEWDSAASWEEEYERSLAALAMKQVEGEFKPTTWRAFLATAVEGRAGAEVATELGMTVGAVYVARSRVMARLKEEVRRLQEIEDGETIGRHGS